MTAPKVYIVILNYRQWEDCRDCLQSVLSSGYANFSVVLIDNSSGNHSLENIAAAMPEGISYSLLKREEIKDLDRLPLLTKVTFIQNNINEGFAAGNNLALRLLQHEDAYVWLLNPDMIVQDDTMETLVGFAEEQEHDCIIGAEVRSWSGNQDIHFYGGGKVNFVFATVEKNSRQEAIPQLDYISGASLFTRAENFKKLGLLPEKYFLYWEETEWCYQAKQQGFRLCVCPGAICFDKISAIIGKSFTAHYYYARNGLLFISKFRKKNIALVLFFMGARFVKRTVTGRWGQARGIWRGTLDFLKQKRHEIQ